MYGSSTARPPLARCAVMPVTETDRTRFRVKDKVFGRKRVPVDAGKVATLRAAGLSGWRLR